MCEAPGSVVTLLCSGIQLYSAERRIADCILADVKRASMCTSAELARLSCSSEATITRLCHKLGFENYRKFQLALARDAMEQQEAQRMRDEGQDELHQALLNILANREEELRATIQAIDTRQLRQILYDSVSARKLVQALLFLWQLQHSVCLREQALLV